MFKIDDKIMYPMHGAGIIEAIEEKEISGEKEYYYVINISMKNLRVMIPVKKVVESGMRSVVNSTELDDILNTPDINQELDPSLPWSQRHRVYMGKIRTGSIYDEAEVIRDIAYRSKKKRLSATEKGVLDQAKQLFLSELILVKEVSEIQATHLFDRMVTTLHES